MGESRKGLALRATTHPLLHTYPHAHYISLTCGRHRDGQGCRRAGQTGTGTGGGGTKGAASCQKHMYFIHVYGVPPSIAATHVWQAPSPPTHIELPRARLRSPPPPCGAPPPSPCPPPHLASPIPGHHLLHQAVLVKP